MMTNEELTKVKQEYDYNVNYAEKWLKNYKETNEEIFKIAFEANMEQVSLYIRSYGIEPDSRYLEMKAEWETLKQGAEI